MIFLILVSICILATISYGIKNNYAKVSPKKYIQKCIIVGLILIPIVGLSQGTFYSHGFDIHWSLFGVVNFIVILVVSLMLVGIVMLYENIKST